MKKLISLLIVLVLLTGCAWAETPGNRLGFEALRELSDGAENQIISPLSLAYAMAMAAEGAQGKTQKEMLDVLGVESPDDVAALLPKLSKINLKQANAAFLPGKMVPKEEYVAALEKTFGAKWFSQEKSSVSEINRWVKGATDDMIDQIVDELAPEIQLVLINAIAMDAKWQVTFDPHSNSEGAFYAPEGDQHVTYMNRQFYADYGERENVQLLKLGYRDCGLKMLIALPEIGGINAVLDGLCAEGLGYFQFREEQAQVKLSMPKTDIAATNPMTGTLQALGAETAFSDDADFSGITEEMPLKIGSVLQKARLILDEEGTRAAAATMMAMVTGAMPQPEEIVQFRMDRPFVFVIADEGSGAVCFAGIVADPNGN